MQRNLLIVLSTVLLLIISIASQSFALTDDQEEKYKEARILLKEGKTSEAKSIFTMLSLEDSSDPMIRLGLIDTTIGEAIILRATNQSIWKYKIQEAFSQLKSMYRMNVTSPDMYLSYARCYAMFDRPRKAKKSLEKAFYYKPNYLEAFIVQGDIYSDRVKEGKGSIKKKSRRSTIKSSSSNNAKNTAKDSYKAALTLNDTDQYTKAMLRYKLGDLHIHNGKKEKGIKNFNKAIKLSPDSYWAERSRQRL